MAKRIEGNEIINDSWAAKAVKQGEDLLKVLEKLEEQGKQTADQLSKVAKTQSGATAKSIRDITQAVSKSNAERKKSIAIDNEKKSLEEKLIRLRSNRIQQNEELKVLISEQTRINKQLARETTGVAGAYEKESKTLIKLRKQLKDLIITEGEGSKKTQELKRRVTELDQKLKSADAAAGQFQRNVGNYPKAMSGAISSLKKFAGALGIVGGVQLLSRALRNSFDIIKNFDQAQANLASVLGVTRDEMSGLTEMAKKLGATTKFTASEVSELQLEFAKLGFTQKEIEGVTEATLQLAAASGTDLGNAASITGSTIRAFGLDVSETQRVVDVMAKSFSASSLDINKFQTAMGNVAPVAASAGLTVEETTAMLGTLTDAGIDASTAGTGLRNVFLELSKTGMTFEEAMNQISSASDKNAVSLSLFGKRGATIGTILANSGSQIELLTDRLNNAGGAAQEMADKQLDTLQGSIQLLNSAWEGLILKMSETSDGTGKLKTAIDLLTTAITFLTENSKKIAETSDAIKILQGDTTSVIFSMYEYSDLLFGTTETLNEYQFATKEASKAISDYIDKNKEQIAQSQDLINSLDNENISREEVNKNLSKLEEIYPGILDSIGKENIATYDLATLKDRLNLALTEELINRKKIQAQQVLENEINRAIARKDSEEQIERIRLYGERRIQLGEAELRRQLGLKEEMVDEEKILNDLSVDNFENSENKKAKSAEQKKLDELKAFKDAEEEKIKILENSLLQQGLDVEDLDAFTLEARIKSKRDIADKIIELDFETNKQLIEHQNEYLKFVDENATERIDVELKTIETIGDAEFNLTQERIENNKKLSESIKKTSEEITKALQEIIKLRTDAIDKEIQASNEQITKSESEVERLQQIGTAQAIASAEAEKRRIEKEGAEIEELEKKKRNLLILTTGLERVNQLIQSGDSNPFQTTGGEIGNFISQLASFYDGTELTVADSLGKTGTKDGHIVRVHDNEHIVSAKDSDRLHANGIYKTSDIVDSALNWKNLNTSSLIMNKRNSDAQLISEIKEMRKAFNSIDFPEQYVYLDRDVFKKQNSIKTVNYSNNRI